MSTVVNLLYDHFVRRESREEDIKAVEYALKHSPNRAFQNYVMPRKGKSKKKVERKEEGRMSVIVMQPPALQSTPEMVHTFRFGSTSATQRNITVLDLLGICGGYCTVVNSTLSLVACTVRLKSVRLYTAPLAGADDVGNLQFTASFDTPDRELVRSAIGASGPAVQTLVPPRRSTAGFWYGNASAATTLFQIASPVGSVVDVTVGFTFINNYNNSSQVIAAGVLGSFYYSYLDGPITHSYIPVGLPSTF